MKTRQFSNGQQPVPYSLYYFSMRAMMITYRGKKKRSVFSVKGDNVGWDYEGIHVGNPRKQTKSTEISDEEAISK